MKTETPNTKRASAAGHSGAAHTGSTNMKDSPIMSNLLDALKEGTDVGEYGRLTFAIVARHFMEEEEIVSLLAGQPEFDEKKAKALLLQVEAKDYSPPKRERILEWQKQQDFVICPNAEDPQSGNLYRELKFPDGIYDHIAEFWEEKAQQQVNGE